MNKKGFTLIEILAVIVIIALLLAIAIPSISKAILNSRKSVFVTTADKFADALGLMVLNDPAVLPSSGTPTCYKLSEIKLEKGSNTKSPFGKAYTDDSKVCVAYNSDTKDYTYSVCLVDTGGNRICNKDVNGNYVPIDIKTVTRETVVVDGSGTSGSDTNTTVTTYYADGTAIYFNPVSGEKCDSASAVSTPGTNTGCMKWYAFADSETATTINLILDHNTTAKLAWNSSGSNVSEPSIALTQLASDTSSWVGVPTRTDSYSLNNGTANYTINYSGYKARLITADEIATITGNSTFDETLSNYDALFCLDSNDQNQAVTTQGGSRYAWLFDYTKYCTNFGCNIADPSTYGYWTATAVAGDSENAWFIWHEDGFAGNNVDNSSEGGLRPVITISKSNL